MPNAELVALRLQKLFDMIPANFHEYSLVEFTKHPQFIHILKTSGYGESINSFLDALGEPEEYQDIFMKRFIHYLLSVFNYEHIVASVTTHFFFNLKKKSFSPVEYDHFVELLGDSESIGIDHLVDMFDNSPEQALELTKFLCGTPMVAERFCVVYSFFQDVTPIACMIDEYYRKATVKHIVKSHPIHMN